MQNLEIENLITLSAASRKLPRLESGKHIHPSTLWRWCKHGLRGKKLGHVHVGKRIYTTPQALAEFVQSVDESTTVPPSGPATERRNLSDVQNRLRKEGF